MDELVDDLPNGWERGHVSGGRSPSWTYHHRYLEVTLRVFTIEAETLDRTADAEYVYRYHLRWPGGEFVGIEDTFEPPGDVTSGDEARDWAVALMAQIDRHFEPGDTSYVQRAMKATVGEPASTGSNADRYDTTTCPVCETPLFQYRGFDAYERVRNHVEYADDGRHVRRARSLEEELRRGTS